MKTTQKQGADPTIRCTAKLLRPAPAATNGAGILLMLPKTASATLPAHGLTMVEGTLNGFPFRAALEANGNGSHRLQVSAALLGAAGADAGDPVTVEITRVGDEPEIRVPMDLRTALAAAPRARAVWADITPMARREWIRWVCSAKQRDTRRHRIETACDMLGSGKRRPCCFPGINWVTKDFVTSEETWLPLPSSKNRSSPSPRRARE